MKTHSATKQVLFGVLGLGCLTSTAFADPTTGTVYYTRYATQAARVNKVDYAYNGTTFSIGTPTVLSTLGGFGGADGIIFAPDGDLLVGGQGNAVHKVEVDGSSFESRTAGGTSSFHLSPDPSGKNIWSGGIPGQLAEIPLTPFSNGIAYTMLGAESGIDSIIFRGNDAFYTSSSPNGNGSFGSITFDRVAHTATTTRLIPFIIAAHGGAYDLFTDSIMLFGNTHITQLKGSDPTVVLSDFALNGASFDQGAVDGKGHALVANPGQGSLFFLDYSASGLVGAAGNFRDQKFIANDIDDVTPLSGIGSIDPNPNPNPPPGPAPVPEANTLIGGAGFAALALGALVRRSRQRS